MNNICFVGFDTSNYTTSGAVVLGDGSVAANIKFPLPVGNGGCGLRQSDAVFAHVKHLPELAERVREAVGEMTVAAVGCSVKPRDAEGSYMPCFLTGYGAAESYAAGCRAPLYSFSHQQGHIAAACYSSGAPESADFAAFHVSGGTTELVHAIPENGGYKIELIGGTDDLNAGQALDRIGVYMGLKFPCGAELDGLAVGYEGDIPHFNISCHGLECNLSGLENKAKLLFDKTGDRALVAAYTFSWIAETLSRMTDAVRLKYPSIPVVYAGGVMGSRYIKNKLKRDGAFFAEPAFSSDNAAGIAVLTRRKYLLGL